MNEPAGDPARTLQQAFGDSLYSAADRLARSGAVLEVRVLQGGNVVTGIVGADAAGGKPATKFRVYIRGAQQECNCGDRGIDGVCVHVAAVSIVAAKEKPAAAQSRPPSSRAPVLASQSAPGQQLCYLLEKKSANLGGLENTPQYRAPRSPDVAMSAAGGLEGIRVSVWVAQKEAGVGSIVPGSACAFALRRASIAGAFEFPRYVDRLDREILPALPASAADDVGAEILLRVVATGRAFLGSLDGTPLRVGDARAVTLVWKTLASGDQVLGWEADEAVDVLLGAEPPLHIDSSTGMLGTVELPQGFRALARDLSRLGAVGPEFVDEVNARIEAAFGAHGPAPGGTSFPRLRSVAPIPEPLRSITPLLVLAADAQALLHFVYNGTPVDSGRLHEKHELVRLMAGAVLYEIPRDRAAEASFRSLLGATPGAPAAWLEFMLERVPALQAQGWNVVVEDGFPYRIVTASQWYGDLGADQRQAAWFNLRLGVMVDGQPVNLLPALTRYLKSSLEGDADADGCRVGQHWLVRLDDGRYLPIEIERIQRIANTLVELLERDGLNDAQGLSLPRSQGGRLAQLTVDLNGPVLSSQDSSLTALIEDLRSFSGIQALQPPPGFHGTLRHYQQEGLGWLQFLRRFRLGGVLADDMGLGKTVQTIAHITLEVESGRLTKPVLIVAPVSALGNWKQELTRFAPGLSVYTWHGAQRRKSLSRLNGVQVIITAYPLLLIDSEILVARDFGLVILDEAQMIKNPASKVSQMARALRADSRLCLSGTPVENHLGELWSLFDFLQPGLLGDERHFQRLYRTPIEKNGDRARAATLSARIAPFLLRRTKDSVAKELPPKVEIIESITLDEKQRDFYDGVRLAMHQRIQEIVREQGLARSQITILDALLKLRQVCCDPRLVRGGQHSASQKDSSSAVPEGPPDGEASIGAREIVPSAKLEWLSTVLPELIAEGRRILLFSQFTSMLRLIEAAVTALGIPYCLLTGETTDRTAVVQRFQSGQVPLFLISLKAGGTALNLTAADTVIHYDPWWNPAVEAQATDRAHRIGQTKSVFVYKLIAQDTVEERMLQLQADKRVLADHLYTQKCASPTALGVEDLEMLLAP
jgi:superfamily II DNA or RNA helicase